MWVSLATLPCSRILTDARSTNQCFKLGRLTLPPALVLSFCGYGKASNWERFEKLHTAGPAAMSAWLKGGWKETDPDAMDEFAAGKPLGEKGERMRENLMAFAT